MSTIVNNDVWFDAIVASKHCNIMLLLRLWFSFMFYFPLKVKVSNFISQIRVIRGAVLIFSEDWRIFQRKGRRYGPKQLSTYINS